MKTNEGKIELTIPRDYNSSFEPIVIQMYEKSLGSIEDKSFLCMQKEYNT
ncbi:MAG: transposase [Bacteroidetes bacterium]|nr:transposase [Bacteroidota bacterium]MBU1114017.1 transposase [Bacteroidota bacterium]MBU1798783.1 transposase [Bacteroidota bacterium]